MGAVFEMAPEAAAELEVLTLWCSIHHLVESLCHVVRFRIGCFTIGLYLRIGIVHMLLEPTLGNGAVAL